LIPFFPQAPALVEPECLIPFVRGIRHVALVGDHQQLSPMIVSQQAYKAGFGRSMFVRLLENSKGGSFMLDVSRSW
jgi:regulator of nonsense transcripts 1